MLQSCASDHLHQGLGTWVTQGAVMQDCSILRKLYADTTMCKMSLTQREPSVDGVNTDVALRCVS